MVLGSKEQRHILQVQHHVALSYLPGAEEEVVEGGTRRLNQELKTFRKSEARESAN